MKKIFIGTFLLASLSSIASTDLRVSIEAQAWSVFATADSSVSSDQAVCFEFGKLIGLGMAYKVIQTGAPLESHINEILSLYGKNCLKTKKLKKRERQEISELSKSVFLEIRN